MENQPDRAQALQRLSAAIQHLSDDEVNALAGEVENRVAWKMAMEKARQLIAKPHDRKADTDTVNYYDLLKFAQACSADVRIVSRVWTRLVGENAQNPRIIEELRRRPIEVRFVRKRSRRFSVKNSQVDQLHALWAEYL